MAAIKDLLAKNKLSNQEELLELLERAGVVVTQATLSRYLKDLGVGKVPNGDGGYVYSLPGDLLSTSQQEAYRRDFHRGFLSMDFAGNIVVIRTLSGHANSVAMAMDNMEIPMLLGTVAGDDTIMAVLKEGADRKVFCEYLDLASNTADE